MDGVGWVVTIVVILLGGIVDSTMLEMVVTVPDTMVTSVFLKTVTANTTIGTSTTPTCSTTLQLIIQRFRFLYDRLDLTTPPPPQNNRAGTHLGWIFGMRKRGDDFAQKGFRFV